MVQVQIDCRTFGSVSEDESPPDVALTLAGSVISVGDLIAHAVTAQINELDQESQQRLERYYLSEGEVQQQAEAGVVALKKIDPVREIDRARRAFVRRAFVVVANGRHLDSLDDELPLTDAMAVQFIRLMPLAAG